MQYLRYFLLLLLLSSCTSTYYIVRHAEKLDQSTDAILSIAGIQRANDLNSYFISRGIHIDSIFVSTYLRTQQTAQPTAIATGNTPNIINQADDATMEKMIARLNAMDKKTVLVVGHTNTVPRIVKELSGVDIGTIAEDDFDNLYIVTIKNGQRSMQHITYGRASPR